MAALSLAALPAPAAQVERFQQAFEHPPDSARIMMRWWWFGPAVTHAEIEREMRLMKEGGIGGFEVQIIDHPAPRSCVPSLQVAASLAAAAIENLRLVEEERELRQSAEASEQRYRASEQRLRVALEAAGLATWEYEAGSDVLAWSPRTDRVLGKEGASLPAS